MVLIQTLKMLLITNITILLDYPMKLRQINVNIKFQHSSHMLLEIGLDVIQAGTLAYEHKNGRYIQLPKHSCIK